MEFSIRIQYHKAISSTLLRYSCSYRYLAVGFGGIRLLISNTKVSQISLYGKDTKVKGTQRPNYLELQARSIVTLWRISTNHAASAACEGVKLT